jgi:hypothetical protein
MFTLAITALLACSGADDKDSGGGDSAADTTPSGPGTLALTFRMNADYIPAMEENGEEPIGTFGGSIYKEADATETGPVDGAVPIGDISVDIDLTDGGGPTDVLYRTDPLDPQIVWILGCLDSDANGCGDVGDPITVPATNKFQVEPGVESTIEIYMGMLRP